MPKAYPKFMCPECKVGEAMVKTSLPGEGGRLRRRKCANCDYYFATFQKQDEPEKFLRGCYERETRLHPSKVASFNCPDCEEPAPAYSVNRTKHYIRRRRICNECGYDFITRQNGESAEERFYSSYDDEHEEHKPNEYELLFRTQNFISLQMLLEDANISGKYTSPKARDLVLTALKNAAEKCGVKVD